MNADDILDALRKAWPSAALRLSPSWNANLNNPGGHDSLRLSH